VFSCKIFEITDEELKTIEEWDNTHLCKFKPAHGMKKYCGAIGGSLRITFMPTSIGHIITVKCGCGAEFEVRDL
jgi:hypothetical protein